MKFSLLSPICYHLDTLLVKCQQLCSMLGKTQHPMWDGCSCNIIGSPMTRSKYSSSKLIVYHPHHWKIAVCFYQQRVLISSFLLKDCYHILPKNFPANLSPGTGGFNAFNMLSKYLRAFHSDDEAELK